GYDFSRAGSIESALAGHHFIEHQAVRKLVRLRSEIRLAPRLLRAHVMHRAEDRSFRSEAGEFRSCLTLSFRSQECGVHFGQSEIDELGARGDQHHVPRLQVPMYHTMTMSRVQPIRDVFS